MERCGVCGASLSADVPWCGQCYTPVRRVTTDVLPRRPPGERPIGDVVVVPEAVAGKPPDGAVVVIPEARPSPTRFGLLVRLVFSALILAVAPAVAWVGSAWIDAVGDPALAFTAVMLAVYVAAAFGLLWGLWRPSRR